MADDLDAFDAHAATHQHQPHIYRPIPRRNFSSHSATSDSSSDPFQQQQQQQQQQQSPPSSLHDANSRSSDFLAQLNARLLRTTHSSRNGAIYDGEPDARPPTKNKSFLNMTRSTLFGIYDDVGASTAGEYSVAETPWGTGAETPGIMADGAGPGSHGYEWEGGLGSPFSDRGMKSARRDTADQQRPRSGHGARPARRGVWKYMVVAAKLASLFLFGGVYGIIVSHLHDTRELAAVRVGHVGRESWVYVASWGLAGVVLGSLLPFVDLWWGSQDGAVDKDKGGNLKESEASWWEQWNEVVRSVGAFVGIAFAIRRLPWQSTLQLTLTLALVNPALWYILDRSRPGLSVSLIVTSIITSFIFLSNPDVLPSPSLPATTNGTHLPSHHHQDMFAGVVSYESLAIATWVGSVLFCSCVCFGNIGRRLAVLDEWRGMG